MSDTLPENPYRTPDASNGSIKSKFWSRLCTAGIVFAILFVLIGLLLPAQRRACEEGWRIKCQDNMRTLGLALHKYYKVHNSYPPAFTVDADGKPLHSWRTLILPYLGKRYAAVYAKIDLSKPWDDRANEAARLARVPIFECPSAHIPSGSTTYLAIVTPDSCIRPERGRTFDEIVDGLENTIVVCDVPFTHAVPWMSPQDTNLEFLLSHSLKSREQHPMVLNLLYCDNHVNSLSVLTEKAVLNALVTVDGGEEIPKKDGVNWRSRSVGK